MANIEKHPKQTMEQLDRADFSAVPTCARASHLIGQYAENGQNKAGRHQPNGEDRAASFTLRFEDLPARPCCINLKRLEISTADRWMRWPHGSHCVRALVAQTPTVVQTGSLRKYVMNWSCCRTMACLTTFTRSMGQS